MERYTEAFGALIRCNKSCFSYPVYRAASFFAVLHPIFDDVSKRARVKLSSQKMSGARKIKMQFSVSFSLFNCIRQIVKSDAYENLVEKPGMLRVKTRF